MVNVFCFFHIYLFRAGYSTASLPYAETNFRINEREI